MRNITINLYSILFIILISFYNCNNVNSASTTPDKYFETKHFVIMYNKKSLQAEANTLSKNIDAWGEEVFKLYKVTPKVKIYVTLLDNSDTQNAYSTGTNIVLYFNLSKNGELEHLSTTWLESVFKHELTHSVLTLYDHNVIYAYFVNTPKSFFIPSWLQEGSAVYAETKLSPNGRMNDELFLYNTRYFYNNNMWNYFFYKRDNAYYDGSNFFNFYIQKYGEDKYVEATNMYMTYFKYVFFSPIYYYAKAANVSSDQLYQEFNLYMSQNFLVPKVETQNTSDNLLIKSEYTDQNRYFNILEINNNYIYYSVFHKNIINGQYDIKVFKKDFSSQKTTAILNLNTASGRINLDSIKKSDNNIYYASQLLNFTKSTLYSSGFIYNEKTTNTEKLKPSRVLNLVKGNNNIIYVIGDANEQSLQDDNGTVLIDGKQGFIFGKLFFDNQNNQLYFDAIIKNSKKSYIFKYDFNTKSLTKIIEGSMPFVANNKLFFTAQPNLKSSYNIYELNLSNKIIQQVTHSAYGAFNPYYYNGIVYYTSNYQYSNGIYFINENNVTKNNTNLGDIKYLNETVNLHNNNNIITYVNNTTDETKSKKINFYNYRLSSINTLDFSSISFVFDSLDSKSSISLGISDINFEHLDKLEGSTTKAFVASYSYNEYLLFDVHEPLFNINTYVAASNNKDDNNEDNHRNYGFDVSFNPMLYNGYGKLPIILLNTKANDNGDFSVGPDFIFNNTESNINFYTDNNRKSGIFTIGESILNTLFINYYNYTYNPNNTKVTINIDPTINQSLDVQNTDFAVNVLLKRNIRFDNIYVGTKDGRFGLTAINVTPYVNYIFTNGNSNKGTNGNMQTGYVGLKITGDLQLLYNFPISAGIYAYRNVMFQNNSSILPDGADDKIGFIFDFNL
ncbi:hypothetical protein ACFX5K_01090 [Rickettsiales bacterium LUAb2]